MSADTAFLSLPRSVVESARVAPTPPCLEGQHPRASTASRATEQTVEAIVSSSAKGDVKAFQACFAPIGKGVKVACEEAEARRLMQEVRDRRLRFARPVALLEGNLQQYESIASGAPWRATLFKDVGGWKCICLEPFDATPLSRDAIREFEWTAEQMSDLVFVLRVPPAELFELDPRVARCFL